MTIKKIFDEISSEPGSNKKMEILNSYKSNELLKKVLYLANSKRIKFYIKQIPSYISDNNGGENLEWALDGLKSLSSREYTGHDGIKWLSTILSGISTDDAYIIERIIEKDCKIGMGTSNINKIFQGLIEKTPYQGCKPFEPARIKELIKKGGAYSQKKMDGRYLNAIIRGGETELESRQGEPTIVTGAKFLEELLQFDDCVLNGELTMKNKPRYESNGIITSIIDITSKKSERTEKENDKKVSEFEKKHGSFQEALDSIIFTVWDCITVDEYFDMKSDTPYDKRLENVQKLLDKNKPTMVEIVENRIVNTYEEAMNHFQEILKEELEGTVVKAIDGPWKNGKYYHQIKLKLEMDVDLKIVGFNYGTGKNSQLISSLNAESSDGKVFTRPTGINEDMMEFITKNQDKLINTIVEVKCCGLSQDSSGNYSLLHPVFKSLRDDKNTCDSLQNIKDIEAMCKGLK